MNEVAASDASLRRFLHGLPGVDEVGAEARAAMLASRSIKTDGQAPGDRPGDLDDRPDHAGGPGHAGQGPRAVREGSARPGRSAAPPVAAVCVYPDLADVAAAELHGSGINVASVATAFPTGRAALDVKLADVKSAVAAGADEVDMVIDRGAFLAGRYRAGLTRRSPRSAARAAGRTLR